jgi:hypothetical protein
LFPHFYGIPADANVLAAVGVPVPSVASFPGVPAVASVPTFAGFPVVAIVTLLLLASQPLQVSILYCWLPICCNSDPALAGVSAVASVPDVAGFVASIPAAASFPTYINKRGGGVGEATAAVEEGPQKIIPKTARGHFRFHYF